MAKFKLISGGLDEINQKLAQERRLGWKPILKKYIGGLVMVMLECPGAHADIKKTRP